MYMMCLPNYAEIVYNTKIVHHSVLHLSRIKYPWELCTCICTTEQLRFFSLFLLCIRTESGSVIHASATGRGNGRTRETTVRGSAGRESGKGRESGRKRAGEGRRNGKEIVWNGTKRREGQESGLPESHGRKRMRRRSHSNHDHPQTCHPGQFQASYSLRWNKVQ